MKKTAILLITFIFAAPAFSQLDQNNCIELLSANMWEKEPIFFKGKKASIEELINNDDAFNADLWYEDSGSFESLGTIKSPKCASYFNAPARFHILAKQQPGARIIWSQDQNAFILSEVWNSEDALGTYNNFVEHKAMLDQFNKKFDAIEQEMQKTLQ